MHGSVTLRAHVDRAVAAGIAVSVCPESVDAHGILDERLEVIGAGQHRAFTEILTEVANGQSTLVGL